MAPRKAKALPDLNALDAAREAARHAQEGSLKLSRAVDVMRTALETIVTAEMDLKTGHPVTIRDLKGLALGALNEYSAISGQSWKRNPLIGDRSGDRSLSNLGDS